jgi:DNA gyrase/topoisomerase IV subunit A
MNLRSKIKGHKAQIILDEVELNHSSAFQFLANENAKENLIAEIERLDKDIELSQTLQFITFNLGEVIQIVRGSHDEFTAEQKLVKQFELKEEHLRFFSKVIIISSFFN